MDELYELISKEELANLRSENKKLKEELEKKESQINTKVTKVKEESHDDLLKKIEDKQREILREELDKISDINKSTLNNVLSHVDEQKSKFDTITQTLQEIIENINSLVEEVHNSTPQEDLSQKIDELRDDISLNELEEPDDVSNNEELLAKLQEIEEFMQKLEMLLSQVKPSNMNMG